MAKFTFSVPGRKKRTPEVQVTEPMTKAHKILGASPLNIDIPRSRGSSTDISNDFAGSSLPTSYDDSQWGSSGALGKAKVVAEPWADESGILPPNFRFDYVDDGLDDAGSSTVLRNKQSSSTIKSFYDKSKMPLSISQQTSSSAMAKGLPPKLHRMLDMDNNHNLARAKKPARLDFSGLMSASRGMMKPTTSHSDSSRSATSPSVLSSVSPGSARIGARLRKRPSRDSPLSPSAESMKLNQGARRPGNRLGELPGLYEHYEKMSFRQVLDETLEEDDVSNVEPLVVDEMSHSSGQVLLQPVAYKEPPAPATSQHLEPPAPPRVPSLDSSPLSDCAASISSGHTRTSKASLATRSFPDSDLQETSILLLSSDSEDDEYLEPATKSPKSFSKRRGSGMAESFASSETGGHTTSTTSGFPDRRQSRSTKRTSFAVSSTYLTIPSGRSSYAGYYESGTTLTSTPDLPLQSSPSAASSHSSSPLHSAATRQSQLDPSVREAPAIAASPAQRPLKTMPPPKLESGLNQIINDALLPMHHEGDATPDQPTPPLSPSSVDFYIRSAHSSVDGAGGHNRFMAVTQQEEMLLAALRQKRQTMRAPKPEPGLVDGWDSLQKHNSNGSQVTITEKMEASDFDFPLPPSFSSVSLPSSVESVGMTALPARQTNRAKPNAMPAKANDAAEPIHTDGIHSPLPIRPSSWQAVLDDIDTADTDQSSPCSEISEYASLAGGAVVPTIQIAGALDYSSRENPGLERLSAMSSSLPATGNPLSLRRISTGLGQGSFDNLLRPSRKSMSLVSEYDDDFEEPGVPRPDSPISPISPGAFPSPPTMTELHKKMARLSAVGPARLGAAPDWWQERK
ncbi:hypothetical protein S40288_03605 [Stachybotrys chartarum IBT 40288]|nr:hypothetical protein S40288_03605 [Stachybotrys chartarum IBT 40288]